MAAPRWIRDPWVWGQFALALAVVVGLPLAAGRTTPGTLAGRLLGPGGGWQPMGLVVMLGGVAVAAAGVRTMGRNLTPATRPRRDATLVTHGIYARVRHPIYLGVVLAMWGYAWAVTSALMGLLVAGVALGYFDRKAAVEERHLAARFPDYPAYRNRVPRLLPRLH